MPGGRGSDVGKYRLLAKLGSGGQADVFLAVEHQAMGLRRLVVLKRLRNDVHPREELIRMFLDEARLATRLAHPNIVHTYEVGEASGFCFIAMEYIEGQTLDALLRTTAARERISHRMWATIASEMLAGLHYAHELRDYDGAPLGIVHRDVSPHNVFVTYDGEVKLVDFGIAKTALNVTKTETGVIKGKISYMAPEQAQGVSDRRSDLFAVGILLWEGTTGKRLFTGNPLAVLNSLMTPEVRSPAREAPGIDPRLDAIVTRALAQDPKDRFQSAEEMREALEAYLRATGEPVKKSELGGTVRATFAEVAAKVRAEIQEHMAQADAAPSDAPVSTLSQSDPALPELNLQSEGLEGETQAFPTAPTDMVSMQPPEKRRQQLFVVIAATAAAAVLFVVGLGVFVGARVAAPPAPPSAATTSAPTRSRAVLSIDSDPPGAIVDWNGSPVGRTPARIELPFGAQIVALSKEGFEGEVVTLDVPADPSAILERRVVLHAKAASPEANAPSAAASALRAGPAKGGHAATPAAPARQGERGASAPSAVASDTVQPSPEPTPSSKTPTPRDTW